jgi:hypothetical protein
MASPGGAAFGANPSGSHFLWVAGDAANANAIDVYSMDGSGNPLETNAQVMLAC